MGSMQLVFLLDLSACKDAIFKPREELNKILLNVRLACLRLLTEFSTKTSNLRWGFKFFDSYGAINQAMCKVSFSDVSLRDFETLENEICVRYERHLSCLEALAESSHDALNLMNDTITNSEVEKQIDAPVKILQQALTQVLYEFQWENVDMWSPSHKKLKDGSFGLCRNFLFLIGNFKENDETLLEYFGLKCLPTKSKFCSTIIPQALQKHLSEKAYIHWVWLNISLDQSFLGSSSSKVLSLLSETLHSIQGSLIPLSLLSQSIYHIKYVNCAEKSASGMEMPHISNSYHSFNNSLLPFSSLFQQSLIQPFYSNVNSTSNKCNLCFAYKNTVIPVQVIKIFNKNAYKEVRNCRKAKGQSSTKIKTSDTEITWSKFIIECATSRDVQCMAYDTLLCLPDDAESTTTSAESLKVLIKTMYGVKISLILTCVTENGLQMAGLLTPLTSEIALIEILDPLIHAMHKFYNKMTENCSLKCEDISTENSLPNIQNFGMHLKNNCNDVEISQNLNDNSSKSFQMESLETWYKPSSVCNVVSFMESKLSDNRSKIDSVPKFLQQALKDYSEITSTKEDETHASVEHDSVDQNKEMDEMLTDLSEEALLSATKEIYNSALEPSGQTHTCAKNIVKKVSNFYKKHGSSSFEENVLSFMKSNLFLNARRISEKYAEQQEATDQKIKECQIQIFLFLETEVLTLPPDRSNCVNSVSALLRIMSFDDNDRSKLKSFCEVLRTSYTHNLHEVLVEIGDEVGVFDFGETESDDSPADTLSSELNNESDIFSCIISPNVSEKSSSSSCSQLGNRKLVRHRSDISSTRSRQILLPRTTPKKKKGKSSAQRKASRCSPRFATRSTQTQNKTEEAKPRNVRRNLFPKEKSSNCSPKKSKSSQLTTPKKIHSSKRKIVPETPSNKQNHSAFQRKKSRLKKRSSGGSPKVIAESPKFPKMAEGEANKEFLKKLRRTSETSLKPMTQSPVLKETANFNYKQYTPESKRRLSLKLFSKLLSGPTLRMGVKKCTKRLFDQVSPQKCSDSNKKHKSCDDSTFSSSAQESKSDFSIVMKAT